MAFDRNSFYKSVDGEAQQPEQPQQAQPQEAENGVLNTPILDSVNNFFSVDAETRQNLYNDAMEDAQHIDINPEAFEENPGIDENVVANYEARRKNIVQAINNAAEEDGFFADKAQSVRASGVYRNYLLNDEERLAQARDIEATTGIQADAILNDDAAFRNAQHVADYVKKQQAAVGPGQVFSLENIYKMYPELAGLADMDEVQTAQALHDIDNIKRTGDAIQDVKNVMGAMWDEGKKKLQHDKLWYKVYQGKATEEEREEAEKLYKELNTPGEAPRMPDFLEHPVEYAMGGLAQSMPEMLEGYKGNMVGGIAGAVVGTGAAIIAAMAVGSTGVGIPAIPAAALFGWKIGSNITGTMSLAEPETGARYAEMSHRTDAKGNRLYTDNELKYVAPAGGLFNAAIENYTNLYLAKKLLPSKSLERAAFESTVRVATEQIAAAQSTRVAANQFAKERIKDIAEGTFAESFEEALQTTSDDMVDNWLVASTGKGKAHSMQDIAKDAFNSFMDALPTSFAFGMAGGAGGTFTGTIGLAEHFNNIAERNQQYNQQAQHTMLGINLVGRLQDAVNASKLKDSNAQLQRKIMHNQLEGSGFEMVYIDTNSLLQREGGREQLDKVAKAAEYDAAAVDAAVKEGTMTVNMETFAQAGTDSTILNDISFNANEPSMEAMMQNARDAIASHEEIAKQAIEEFNKTKDIIIEHYFADDKEAAEQAIIAMYSNPQNPAAGIRKIEKELKAAKQEILAPALDRLQQGMGNGVEIVQNDDSSGVRVSNNEAWYQKFYAARGRAPYKWELEQMAADMLTGEASAPEVEGWRITTQEEYDSAAEIRKKLKDIDNELKVIDRVKEKMADLSSSEMQQIIGLTPEAFSVYRTIAEQLKSAPGTAARAARLNAILFARHADRFAQIMTEKSGMKYTALDYYNRVKVAFDGEQMPGALTQQEWQNQKDIVRQKYEGTDKWMKAPNGQDTKLTEEQWVTVRTEAFKNWFGDWENDAENASKVVDENGDPKVVYHGTATEGIQAFEKRKATDKIGRRIGLGLGKGKFYFIDHEGSARMAARGAIERGTGKFAIVMPLFLNIRKPVSEKEYRERYQNMTGRHIGQGYDASFQMQDRDKALAKLDRQLKKEGYDGTIEYYDNDMLGQITAWDNHQIKHAVDNNGEFSTTHENIYFQPVTNPYITLNTKVKTVPIIRKFAGKEWFDARDNYPKEIINQIITDVDNSGVHKPIINKLNNAKILIGGKYIKHMLSDHTSNESKIENRRDIDRYEIIAALPKILEEGVMVEEHADKHNKANRIYRLFCPVQLDEETTLLVRVTLKNEKTTYKVDDSSDISYTSIKAYDEEITKKEFKQRPLMSSDEVSLEGSPLNSLEYSIVDLLNGVNDNHGVPYIVNGKLNTDISFNTNTFEANSVVGNETILKNYMEYSNLVEQYQTGNEKEKAIAYKKLTEKLQKDVFNQVGKEKALVSYHNITEPELIKALDFGGFPVPSIAVMKKDVPYDKYGGITLVGTKDMVNPGKGVPVYAKDGYTVTFPPIEHAKPKKKQIDAFDKKWGKMFEDFGSNYIMSSLRNYSDSIDDRLDELKNSLPFHYYYLTNVLGKDVTIPKVEEIYKHPLMKNEATREKILEALKNDNADQQKEAIKGILTEYYDAQIALRKKHDTPLARKAAERLTNEKADQLGLLEQSPKEVAAAFAAEYDKVENSKINGQNDYRTLHSKIKVDFADEIYSAQYDKWAANVLKDLAGEDYVRVGNKLMPFNLQNVVQSMIKKAGAGKEKTFTFGGGKVAARAARQFGSIDEMHQNEKMLGTDKEFAESSQKANDLGEKYRSAVMKEFSGNYDIFGTMNDAMEALADAADKKGYTTKSKLKSKLTKALDVKDISDNILELGVEYLAALTDTTTQYFEAKPQRAVDISEFAGAVVPNDANPELVQRLKDAGLQIETYDANIEGDRQKATERIQQQPDVLFQDIKGATSNLPNGNKLIQLFETADESTFLHEMGHLFLLDLEDLARIDEVSANELATIRGWAEWKKGDYKKYKNTPWYKEFADREQAIIDADMNGDVNEAIRLRRVWMQERFARGFELYLREGKAPAKGLRSVFRKFASFLRQVYSAFVSDGSRASAEVEAIMARMIATDKEIEAVAMDDGFKDIEKAGGEKLLTETERETYERWLNEAKEEAREKLHKEVFKDLMQRDKDLFEEHLKIVEEKKRAELEQEPIYLAREIVKSMGGDKRGALNVFDSIEQYEAADKAAPELEKALQDYLNEWRKEYEAEEISMKVTEEAVREAMESSAYHQRAKALEAAAMARKLDLKRKINSKAEQALQGVQDALDAMPEQMDLKADKTEAPVRAVMAKINSLRFSTKWSAKDFAQIERMIKAASREELQQEIKKFKDEMKQQKLNVQAVEEANKGRLKLYADIAKQQIAQQPIFNATNVNEHKRKQRKAEANVLAMVKAGQFQLAIQQQQSAALSAALAKEATKAKEEVDKIVAAINKQLTARSVKLPAKERYWHRWLCYNLRLGEIAEPEKPVLKNGQQLGTLQELLEGYKDRLDLLRDYDATGILDIINANQQTGYKSMTIADFQKVKDLLDIIYKCGKDEFSLKTISGVTIDEAVTEIISEASLADKMKVQRRKIQANTGGLGWNDWAAKIPVIGEATAKYGQSYLSIGMKPEKLIELLGTKASKYIYGTLDKAANDEAAAMAKAIQDVQAMLAGFSHADRRAWKDLKYELLLPGEGGEIEKVQCSKENIICMALNLGTEKNRQRLTGGLFGPAPGATEEAQKAAAAGQTNSLITFCQQNMTKEEWQLVQNIWDYIHSYWADTCRVEEELNGQHLMAEAAMPFTVVLPSGEIIDMKGGYFPVDFNPEKNAKAAQQAQDDVAQQQAGGAKVFGAGRKFVKARSDADVFRELSLRFDTIPTHLQQVIHNITHRLAARDVYRLLNNANMTRYIEEHLGAPYRDILIQWAKDCWTQLPEKDMPGRFFESVFASLRRNSTFAIMAYRIWPVVENLSNIGPTADRIGAVNALSAVFEFYSHMADFRKLMDKSVLMRNRLNNMDRDIRSQEGLFKADNKVFETLREHGYDAMTYSDLMFSAPLWCRAYKDNYMRCYQEAYADNEANKKRLQEAQDNLDKLRGELLDNKKDINDWHAEKRNRAKAGQVGWQPGTSRFAVMPRSQFDIQLPELESKTDTISKKIWEAEIELGHAAELKIYQGAALVAEAERRAVNAADAAVRDAFGSGRTVDLAAVSRTQNELVKSLTTFYSFFNTQFNAIYFKYLEGKYNSNDAVGTWGKMQAWSPFAKSVINRVIVTALIGSLLKMATKTDGDDDKDKYRKVKNKDGKTVKEEIPWLERFLKVFAKNTLSMSFGAFYGIRDVANLAMNIVFDGTDYGRGLNVTSTPLRSMDEMRKTIMLIASKSKRDLEIQEQQEREAAKYKKMSRAQKRKYDEEKKYKQPIRRITYEEIFRHGLNSICGFSAATTGLASTVVDSVTGTMQYLLDTDNRFDATWRNILWSAIFDKKPVERKPEPKPEPKKKKKK